MVLNRIHILAAALTGCAVAASAYAIRQKVRRLEAHEHKEDLRTWEGEGGKPATSALPPPVQAEAAASSISS